MFVYKKKTAKELVVAWGQYVTSMEQQKFGRYNPRGFNALHLFFASSGLQNLFIRIKVLETTAYKMSETLLGELPNVCALFETCLESEGRNPGGQAGSPSSPSPHLLPLLLPRGAEPLSPKS